MRQPRCTLIHDSRQSDREGFLHAMLITLSFTHDAVAVEINGKNLALCVEFQLDVACRLQWVVFALSADQHSSG